jgi:hypothetical protein
METTESVFCSGHTFTKDGGVAVLGGHVERIITPPALGMEVVFTPGLDGVRILDPTESLQLVRQNTMALNRWYPSTGALVRVGLHGAQHLGAAALPCRSPWLPFWPAVRMAVEGVQRSCAVPV